MIVGVLLFDFGSLPSKDRRVEKSSGACWGSKKGKYSETTGVAVPCETRRDSGFSAGCVLVVFSKAFIIR